MVDIKSTSNAVWWIKNPKEQQKQRSQSWGSKFCQDMTDLFPNMSLHGYGALFEKGFVTCEKFIWLCFHVTILCCTVITLTFTWDQYVLQYFAINLRDPSYPVEKVPFPAVSICSNNRISRKAAEIYATELAKRDPDNRTVEYFTTKLYYLREFYQRFERSDDFNAYEDFQKFLDHYGTSDNDAFYNVLDIMTKLTPKCEDFIRFCKLGSKPIDCIQDLAFRPSQTMYGLCCKFNPNDRERTYKTRFVGAQMGLTVILNTSQSDDTVSLLNMNGYAVIIHASNKFPDTASGNCIQAFPMANEETYIAIKTRYLDTDMSLESFSPTTRKCYFQTDEEVQNLLLHNRYSLENCITRCRMRSIIALCNCIPFYAPQELLGDLEVVPYCTLSNIECMQQYKFKWRNVLTQRVDILGLERESEDALYCPYCLPACKSLRYTISMTSLPTDRFSLPAEIDEPLYSNLSDIAVLHVYFAEATSPFYMRVITNTWAEALSTVGNIVSIFMGFSLVALLEILYYLLQYSCIPVTKYVKANTDNIKTRKNSQLKQDILYICP